VEKPNERDFIIFSVDQRRLALPLLMVERVLRMVAITPLPDAPGWVVGMLNLHGRLLPVVDLRLRLGRSFRPYHVDDRLIVLDLHGQAMALVVDQVQDMSNIQPQQYETAPGGGAASGILAGVIRWNDELIPVLDPGYILSEG
jgi:purine-binding chemotaxis protein CheW